jgi:hypothetical protein
MTNEYRTNEELAGDYLEVMKAGAFGSDRYKTISRKLSNSLAYIPGWFECFGRLDHLPLEGIGAETRKVLERLLAGEKEIILSERKQEKEDRVALSQERLRSQYFRTKGVKRRPDSFEGGSSWENGIRAMEK